MKENKQGSNYFLQQMADAIESNLLIVRKNRIVFANERFASLIGIYQKELAGHDITDFLFNDIGKQAFLNALNHFEQGEYVLPVLDVRMVRSDGSPVHFRGRYGRMDWDDVPATFLFMNDITHHRPLEQKFFEFQELDTVMALVVRRILTSSMSLDDIIPAILNSVLSHTKSSAGFMVIDNPGKKILYEIKSDWMDEDCSLPDVFQLYMEKEEFMGKWQAGRIKDAFFLNEPIAFPMKQSDPVEISGVLRVPTWNPQGDIDGFTGQIVLFDSEWGYSSRYLEHVEKVIDVFNLVLIYNKIIFELEVERDRAEKESESRSQFLANIGHEIRSPLNGVIMMASLLSESDLDEEQRDQLNIIMFSARTIDRLVNDITHLTLIKTGKITIQENMFDFHQLCRHIVEMSRYEFHRKALEMEVDIDDDVRLILGDRERISQIVTNLFSNAVKYTEKGSVHLAASEVDGMLCIEVSDTGIGIRPEYRKSIFDIYHQAGERKSIGGTGLGLFIVKELVAIMKGRLELESVEGKGSRFTVFLPLKRNPSYMVDEDVKLDNKKPSKIFRILVAEDEAVSRLFLRTFLEHEGYTVEEAANGVEAVDSTGRNDFDLIFMDINMPLMDGLEATSRIRISHPKIPVIAVTAYSHQQEKERILASGADDIILKPVDESDLRRTLARYLKK